LKGLHDGAQAISFSADGTKLAASSQFEVATWDINTGKILPSWQVSDENVAKRFIFASAMSLTRGVVALGK